jgi:hypothetical protein
MATLRWVKPDKENLPPEDTEILVKYKYGIISAYWDKERYDENGSFVWTTYCWQDLEGYMYEFISMDAFNSVFEDDLNAN